VVVLRHTRAAGKTRLFYQWESAQLTNSHWRPMGIAMQADPQYGETPGGLQAPFVFKENGRFVMVYGDWEHICSAESSDGKTFTRRLDVAGRSGLFSQAPGANTRDPMVLRVDQLWHCYYTAHPQNRGAVYALTSIDLRTWSASRLVARGGRAGTGPGSAECPFVVETQPGHFYLFRTQRYGPDAQTSVYHSTDPLNFGVDDDSAHFVCTLPVAAPEILNYQGQTFIAALLPSLKGIQITRLIWEPRPSAPAQKR